MELFSMLAQLLFGWLGRVGGQQSSETEFQRQKELQEDAQHFTHTERVEQDEYQQQMHEFNMFNDYNLMYKGMVDNGVSKAAAAQALTGAPSTGYAPTASNQGSGIPDAPSYNQFDPQFNAMSDALNEYFNNMNKSSETKERDQNVVYSKQMIDESKSRMAKMANDMHIDNEQLSIAQKIADSTIGLNKSQIDLNYAKLDEVNTNITKMFAEIENIDAQTIESYVRQSLYKAQTENYVVDTALKNAQITYVNTQTQGQEIENLDKNIVLTLKQARLEVSQRLGVDIDSDDTTKVLMAMAQGKYATIKQLMNAYNMSSKGETGVFYRGFRGSFPDMQLGRVESLFNGRNNPFNVSFQPIWNPAN